MSEPQKVLLVHPKFNNTSFWNYRAACELAGAKYPAPPLGLITVAAMLPDDWEVRLIDRNVASLSDDQILWADMVMLGGMLPQETDLLATISRVQALGVPAVVGGPYITSEPEDFEETDIRLLGEVEGVMDDFLSAWNRGERKGTFKAPLHTVDITTSPIPRFDLLNFQDYEQINVQFSRGCPFLCEFCDIIELFGRKPRTKTIPQMLAELDEVYRLGHRGHVDFVDDNLIGNKKAVKAFLPHLIDWQKKHGYPFEFSTEASLNLADDDEFLQMMSDAGFFAIFVGIESPDPDVLVKAQKKQNTKRDIAACIHKINRYGMFVLAGFIVGFDNEGDHVADGLIELIDEASIAVAMAGLLYALPNTQLTRRLEAEGRFIDIWDNPETRETGADQCTVGLNFETTRPRHEVIDDLRRVVAHLYDRNNYFTRVRRTVDLVDASGPSGQLRLSMLSNDMRHLFGFFWRVTFRRPDMRGPVWRLLFYMLRTNPNAIRHGLYLAGLYAHLGQFSTYVVRELEAKSEKARLEWLRNHEQPAPEDGRQLVS